MLMVHFRQQRNKINYFISKVLLKTSVGDIDIELWAKETPKACRNFIQLCMEGYYDGTIFHRLIKGFIVQGSYIFYLKV